MILTTVTKRHFCRLHLTEQAAGVYHRESRKGRYQLTYKEAKAVCKFEGGNLANYKQLEAARQIGVCDILKTDPLTHKHTCHLMHSTQDRTYT